MYSGVNFATVKFMAMIEELKGLSKNGIKPFCEANSENFGEYVFYDEDSKNDNGLCNIVLSACLAPGHHDAISYYDSFNNTNTSDYSVGVNVEDADAWIEINCNDGSSVVIQNGNWEFVH